jgi:hypothetical protein
MIVTQTLAISAKQSTQKVRRIEARAPNRLLCYLCDDLCDIVRIDVEQVVEEPRHPNSDFLAYYFRRLGQ